MRIFEILEPRETTPRIPWKQADEIRHQLAPVLRNVTSQWSLNGSYRRMKSDVGDLDVLVTDTNMVDLRQEIEQLEGDLSFVQWVTKGPVISICLLDHRGSHVQADFNTVPMVSWGAAMIKTTGSGFFNQGLRAVSKRGGVGVVKVKKSTEPVFKLNEYSLSRVDNGEVIASKTEEEIFSSLGLNFIPPENRSVDDYRAFYNVVSQFKQR